jgi:pimeloyl-ACP methyl ester carboxylesterase
MADGHWVWRVVLAVVVGVLALSGAAAPTSTASGGKAPDRDVAGPVDVGGRQVYLECRGPFRAGRPTVVLISGFGNAADIWNVVDPAVAPPPEPVLPALARTERVCAYDRPNTLLTTDAVTDRSTPVPQPRPLGDWVTELHTLLGAAQVPGPYLLVGHSFGGLAARLYASTHPEEVAGLVLIDATNEELRTLLSPEQWAFLTSPPPAPEIERIDWDVSFDQVIAARTAVPLRPGLPLVVLSAGRFDELPPGLPDPEGLVRAQRAAQADLARLVPGARQVIAAQSSHYVQLTEPGLIVDAVIAELRDLAASCPATDGPR